MTTPVGTPDWLKSVPGAAKGIFGGNYSGPGSNTATIGIFNVQAYRALGIIWTPLQSQYLTLDFADDPALSTGGTIRRVTKNNPGQGLFTIPTTAAYVGISITRQDGLNNPTGALNVIGESSADRPAAVRGVTILDTQANFTTGAASTNTREFPVAAEGLASFYIRCTATSYSIFIDALDTFNTWNTLTEVTNTDPTPSRFTQHLPPLQCRLRFTNNDAALRAVAYAVTIGD